ncbi:hypothetical protein OSB04_028538 [Centaurea solstitialis]|uniref:CCHC-type domain-containing protein n=1 Tax=Centaurea solstitialis TaxID=347529 RepID=A0AA38VXU7_9ASTR|nr:hypothetical protein OSB04_028538 [Centaurea solstitialis]
MPPPHTVVRLLVVTATAAAATTVVVRSAIRKQADASTTDCGEADRLARVVRSYRRRSAWRSGRRSAAVPPPVVGPHRCDPQAASTCFKCQGKGRFATECRYKNNQFIESSTPASKDRKYQKLKSKYRKLKFQRKGKGLIAEGKGWDESSNESSDEEDTSEVTCLMAIAEETEPALMAQLEDISEEEVTATSASIFDLPQVSTPSPSNAMTTMDALTIDLYNALNGKSFAEKVNFDFRTELKECHEKLKELAVFETSYKDQVHANQVLCIEREQAITDKEKALAELNSNKVTVKSWADASEKVDEILATQHHPMNRTCLEFFFISKDEAATSDQPSKNSKSKKLTNHPPKPKNRNHKTSKVLGGGPTGSGAKKSAQSLTPRLKVDLITKPQQKTPIPPQTKDIGILGHGPAHLKLKNPKGPSKSKTYRNCYHCGQNHHIASFGGTCAKKYKKRVKSVKNGDFCEGKENMDFLATKTTFFLSKLEDFIRNKRSIKSGIF